MKSHLYTLILSLAILAPQSPQVHAETLAEIFNTAIRGFIPCSIPCFVENLETLTKKYQEDCIPELNEATTKLMLNVYQNLGGQFTVDQAIAVVFNNKLHCDLIEKVVNCSRRIVSSLPNCENMDGLLMKFDNLYEKIDDYLNCGVNSDKADILPCLVDSAALARIQSCPEMVKNQNKYSEFVHKVDQLEDIDDYRNLYTEYFITENGPESSELPRVCQMAGDFRNCVIEGLDHPSVQQCSSTTIYLIQKEMNAVLDLFNCYRQPPTPEHNIIRCLAKPELIYYNVTQCVLGRIATEEGLDRITEVMQEDGSLPTFDFSMLCGVVDMLDQCVEEPLTEEPDCRNASHWTLDTYRRVVYPTRNLILEKCNRAGQQKPTDHCKFTDDSTDETSSEDTSDTDSGDTTDTESDERGDGSAQNQTDDASPSTTPLSLTLVMSSLAAAIFLATLPQ